MKKNMVLKDNIVAIEIKRFTRACSRGSSEQKIIRAKKKFFLFFLFLLFVYFYFLSLKFENECKKNIISEYLNCFRICRKEHFTKYCKIYTVRHTSIFYIFIHIGYTRIPKRMTILLFEHVKSNFPIKS